MTIKRCLAKIRVIEGNAEINHEVLTIVSEESCLKNVVSQWTMKKSEDW